MSARCVGGCLLVKFPLKVLLLLLLKANTFSDLPSSPWSPVEQLHFDLLTAAARWWSIRPSRVWKQATVANTHLSVMSPTWETCEHPLWHHKGLPSRSEQFSKVISRSAARWGRQMNNTWLVFISRGFYRVDTGSRWKTTGESECCVILNLERWKASSSCRSSNTFHRRISIQCRFSSQKVVFWCAQ